MTTRKNSNQNFIKPQKFIKLSQIKSDNVGGFKLEKCIDYLTSGVEAIIEDDVTPCFKSKELDDEWNLLTRNSRGYEKLSFKLFVVWISGILIRYLILFPCRVVICIICVRFYLNFNWTTWTFEKNLRFYGTEWFSRWLTLSEIDQSAERSMILCSWLLQIFWMELYQDVSRFMAKNIVLKVGGWLWWTIQHRWTLVFSALRQSIQL